MKNVDSQKLKITNVQIISAKKSLISSHYDLLPRI